MLPHFEQNFASGRLAVPHEGQPAASGAPQLSQKRPFSRTSDLQPGHCMPHLTVRHPQYMILARPGVPLLARRPGSHPKFGHGNCRKYRLELSQCWRWLLLPANSCLALMILPVSVQVMNFQAILARHPADPWSGANFVRIPIGVHSPAISKTDISSAPRGRAQR